MADFLRGQGYSTHAVGKWHLGLYKKEYTPLHRGFDSFYGTYLLQNYEFFLKNKMRCIWCLSYEYDETVFN